MKICVHGNFNPKNTKRYDFREEKLLRLIYDLKNFLSNHHRRCMFWVKISLENEFYQYIIFFYFQKLIFDIWVNFL